MVEVLTHPEQRGLQPASPGRKRTRSVITPAPATPPTVPPRPQGDLDTATLETINWLVDVIWPRTQPRCSLRRAGLRWLLAYLEGHPGRTWQERWVASGLNDGHRRIRELTTGNARLDGELGHSLLLLCCLRVIRPSLAAFRVNSFVRYHEHFEAAQNDPDLERFLALVNKHDTSGHFKRCARFDVAAALTTQGIAFADLSAEALLHYAIATREGGWGAGYESYVGHLAWRLMAESGHFPVHVPATLRGAMRTPAMTPTELVDRHNISDADVHAMFVAYLTRRSHDIDYSTLRDLAADLCGKFWTGLLAVNPGQVDFTLTPEDYENWRAVLEIRRDGKPRLSADAVLTNIRAVYLDIQGWAAQEPERWARWVAPCPIGSRETRSQAKTKRRAKERMDGRIRLLQPVLPAFVGALTARRDHLHNLLTAATDAERDQELTVGSKRYRRLFTAGDARHALIHGRPNIRVLEESTGRKLNVTFAEDASFWQWAAVETLRHTGLRCEELLELSQLSIRQYVRPNGEVVALLVVAPSKTDRERVIPMTAELFHVIATIIRRLTRNRKGVPLATRFDKYERITSEPQPFLFQRTIGQRTEVITPETLRAELAKLSDALSVGHPELAGCRFTPHDFRRLFATDLVNHGLPIHIGAALLGHLDVQTTHRYVTVFHEDVIRHYQAHLAGRRAARPAREYRSPSLTEWAEFEEHFDKRKVELGNCGRPYATPCEHEHACIRCPMLQVDPGMIDRLDEINTDLIARRKLAQTKGWLGELEGIDLTLQFLKEKRFDAQRSAQRGPTNLGIPVIRAE
ncbi:tyrosine-type recombinase/integrase [Pseudarthrobacter sp. NPDC058329]|uniref:tyrosine-type recombinase/integrase n=1 Tax=Pseudarthrobacter sp. NPDC058329 TaxID=3346448 RepID=UPI0036D7ED7D